MAIKKLQGLDAIRRWVVKTFLKEKEQTGVMVNLPKKDFVDLNTSITAERLMRNGIDPNSIKSVDQVENIINQLNKPKVVSQGDPEFEGIMSKMMGSNVIKRDFGKPFKEEIKKMETEAEIAERITKDNQKGIANIRKKQKMLADAIDDASPGFANDIKVDAELVAENLAERMGLVYDDLPTKERLDLYDQAYTGLSKQRFKNMPKPEPEDKADGGRIGFKKGMDRRTFMKMVGGLTALPILGKFFKGAEVAAPVAEKAAEVASGAPPYFFNLVDRIRALGTKFAGPKERSESFRYKDYEMDIDYDTGAIEIKKTKEAMIPGGDEAGVAEEVIMTYKPGMADETTKGRKVVDEYEEYTARPDIDGKMKDVEDGVPDEVVKDGSISKEELEQEIIDQIAREKKSIRWFSLHVRRIMPDPVSHGQMMNYLVRNSEDKKRMREYFETNQITTASNINRPREPKLTQIFQDFNERNPLADGGRIGFNNGSPDNLTKQKIAAKKYGMSLKKYQRLSQKEKTKLKDKARREADKAAGVSVDGERVSKNIRKLPNGTFRFETESGGGFSKIFSKGTTLKQAEKFRDEYMKDLDEKGLLKKRNPKRGEYKSVEGQKHIKFNGVNYQVSLQRGDEGAQYFSNLKDAVKERNRLVKKYPPKSFRDFNIKERPKKVNAEILQLSKNPTIKNIFKTGKLTDEAITKAANILGVNKATAIDRLEALATAYTGDRKNVPGIKPAFIKNARNIAALLPGAKTKAAELATGVPFIGESIKVPKQEIVAKADYPTDIVDIDEARATATGLKRGTSPYSIFGQIIDRNVNRVVKGGFGGFGWDSRAGTLEAELDQAIKNFGANSKEARAAKVKYNQEATKFENEINSKKLRGAKRVRIPRISLDAPSQTIANYNKFNKKYKNIFDQNFKTKQYSFIIPKDLKTIPELRNEILDSSSSTYKNMINTLKKGFNEFDEKKLFDKIQNSTPKQLQRIMKLIPRIASVDDFETNRFASADNIMTDATVVDDQTFAERNPVTTGTALTGAGTAGVLKAAGVPIKQAAGRIIGGAFGPTGIGYLTGTSGGYDFTSPFDRLLLSSEAALAPELVKGTIGATKGMKNRALQKIAQRALNLGMSVPTALKVARFAQPLGIMGGVIEGSVAAGKNISQEANRIADIKDPDLQQLEYENFIKNIKGFAGGGLAKQAGDRSGAMLRSMNPDSQGLSGLLKRGKKI